MEIQQLFLKHGYEIQPTTPYSSHENALVEQPHHTIGHAMRSMLEGASLTLKYWPFAFYNFIQIYNVIPHGKNMITPFEHITKKLPNLSHFKTFGCRCYVRLPGWRISKLENNVRKGIFLGYTVTLRHIHYLELDTGRLKTALHANFDKGMGDLDKLTPNSRQLRLALGCQLPK